MARMLRRADARFRRIEGVCAISLLVAIVVLVAVASAARAAGSPIIWSIEVAQLLFVWLCVLAADIALQRRRHFGLSIVLERLPPRARSGLERANLIVLALLLGFLLVYAWRNMILMHPRLFGATQMHGSWLHASMVAGFALMLRTVASHLLGGATAEDHP